MNDIGFRILSELEKLGMTQRELANEIGVTEATMSRYVNGTRIPKAPVIVKMANVFGITVDALLNDAEPSCDELKPCPFCGAKENWLNYYNPRIGDISFQAIYCRQCGGSIIDTDDHHSPNDIRRQWNRRTAND